MRAVVPPSMIKSVYNALLKNDNLMMPIATYASSYVKKNSKSFKEKENRVGRSREIRKLPPSSLTSNPSEDDDIRSKRKKS